MSQGSNFFRIIVLFDLEVGTVVTLVLQSPGRERKERIMPGEETLIRKVESIRLLADGSPFLMMD